MTSKAREGKGGKRGGFANAVSKITLTIFTEEERKGKGEETP